MKTEDQLNDAMLRLLEEDTRRAAAREARQATFPETPLTTAAKIAAIEASGFPLAFDGCHKIYFLEDEERRKDAAEYDYEPFLPSTELRECIARSCGLVFVSRWGFDNGDFDHPWNIPQFTEDIRDAASAPE